MLVRVALVLALLIAAFQSSSKASENLPETMNAHSAPVDLSPRVYDAPIILPKSLERRREEFRQYFIRAQTHLRKFARENGWEQLTDKPFVKQVEIYDTKDGFDNRIRQLSCVDEKTPIPKTFSAGIEQDIFFAVSPEIYEANFVDGREPDAYEKLMTHELAHRLHVRICMGDENKMGPIWFWEGFAIYAADQFKNNRPELTSKQILSIVGAKERGSYKLYNIVFRHFLKGRTLCDYVRKAGEPGFVESLKE